MENWIAVRLSLPAGLEEVRRKLAKSETAATTADPMAIPLVMALVVLPVASRSVNICRADVYCAGGKRSGWLSGSGWFCESRL